jgi:hypothetical protein
MTYGSNSSGDKDTIFLGYDVVSIGKELLVFLRRFLPPFTNLQTLHTRNTGSSCPLLYRCMYDNYDIIFTGKMTKANTQETAKK